ncbi:Bardet-Biedl syndrome 12 protein [Suncus etruscus]|uniref:Bardet-Biedl syndrome 12 protein n=1 Tax=Suncus etruscus TaxID=109475 RepID=UPI00210F980C|nr:Bardet-Biedl syndrome 12 protein [Suncus etruscus]
MTACGHRDVVNPRRHRGLQELSMLAEAGRTFLGPAKASKFVMGAEGQEVELVRSARRLLGALDLSSAVGQLLWEAVEAQHSAHHVGTSTLLFLVGAWSRAIEECLQLGVPIPTLVAGMSEGLSICLQEVPALHVPLSMPNCDPSTHVPSASWTPAVSYLFLQKDNVPGTAAACLAEKTAESCPTLRVQAGEVGETTAQASEGGLFAEPCPWRLTLMHSRHFARTRGTPGERRMVAPHIHHLAGLRSVDTAPRAHPWIYSCEVLGDLAELEAGLSHGDPGSMELVSAVARWQWHSTPVQPGTSLAPFSLDLSQIFTCCLLGFPKSSSCVCPGFVVTGLLSQAALVAELQAQPIRVVLLEGDLTVNYRHPGFREPAWPCTMLVSGADLQGGSEELWEDLVLQVLTSCHVNLVLAHGHVSEHLLERCTNSGCLALGSISGQGMQALAETSGAVPLAYVTQVEQHCVGTGLRVTFAGNRPWEAEERTGRVTIALQAEGSLMVTAVLADPVAARLPIREDGFWTCAHRLHQALQDGQVFLGGGAVELLCLSHLHAMAEQGSRKDHTSWPWLPAAASWLASTQALYRPAVLRCLARGWHMYLCALLVNTTTHPTELEASICIQRQVQEAVSSGAPAAYIMGKYGQLGCGASNVESLNQPDQVPRVFDLVTPKVEAWRRALDLVLLVLQTDYEVNTGLGPPQLTSQESGDLIFL